MIHVKEHISLLPYNTFGMDVRADRLLEYDSVEDLHAICTRHLTPDTPHLVIGEGSNLLFRADFRGTVIRSRYRFIGPAQEEADDTVLIEAGSGVVWDDFAAYCVDHDLYGAENLSLIPGQVGAAAVQNIGAYGVEAKDLIHRVHAMDIATGEMHSFSNEECRYAYRDSIFKNAYRRRYIVTSVVFRLSRREQYRLGYQHLEEAAGRRPGGLSLQNVRKAVIEMRENKLPDPHKTGNAGSFFKNPVIGKAAFDALHAQYPDISHFYVSETEEKVSAAWLIDRCGWKGQHIGAAGVHDRQPLVLVNRGGATGEDIIRLAEAIQASVRERFGIVLHPEVNYIG